MTYKRYRYTLEFWPDEGDDFTEEQRAVLDRSGDAAIEAAAEQINGSGIGYLSVGVFYEDED